VTPRPSTPRCWRKSSRSSGGGGSNCIEVAAHDETIAVRDSKVSSGRFPYLTVSPDSWQTFIDSLKTN